jgi:hypothetical protein
VSTKNVRRDAVFVLLGTLLGPKFAAVLDALLSALA